MLCAKWFEKHGAKIQESNLRSLLFSYLQVVGSNPWTWITKIYDLNSKLEEILCIFIMGRDTSLPKEKVKTEYLAYKDIIMQDIDGIYWNICFWLKVNIFFQRKTISGRFWWDFFGHQNIARMWILYSKSMTMFGSTPQDFSIILSQTFIKIIFSVESVLWANLIEIEIPLAKVLQSKLVKNRRSNF